MDEVRDAHIELNSVLSDEPSLEGPNLIMPLDEVRERFPNLPKLSLEDRRFINLCDSNVIRIRLKVKPKGSPESLPSHERYKRLHMQSHALSYFERNILHGVFGALFEDRRYYGPESRTVLTLLAKFNRCNAQLHQLLRYEESFYGLSSLPEEFSTSLDKWISDLMSAPSESHSDGKRKSMDSPLEGKPSTTPNLGSSFNGDLRSRLKRVEPAAPGHSRKASDSQRESLLHADLVPGEFIREMILSGRDATRATLQYIIQRGVPPELGSLLTMEMGFAPSPVDLTSSDLPRIDYDSATAAALRLTLRSITGRISESPTMTWPEAEFEELFELSSQFRDLDAKERRRIMFLYMREATDRCKLLGFPGIKRPGHRSARDASLLIT
jgi:hypothetical protein